MVTSNPQTLSDLDDLLQDLQNMVPNTFRPLPSPPAINPPVEISSDDLYSDPATEIDGYEVPPAISFPSPPPFSPSRNSQVEPNPLDILEQQMAALEALKEQNSIQLSPSHTYAKPFMDKKSPPKIAHKKSTVADKPEPPKFPPNQGPADYLETRDVKIVTKPPQKEKKSELLQLDKLLESLNEFGSQDQPFAASLSYDHLAKGQPSQAYDVLNDVKQKPADYDYTEIPSNYSQEAEYDYPEVRNSNNEIEEHFYEAIPTDGKKLPVSKVKEPSPYMEVSPSAKPKLSGFSGRVPPRPTYKPNERANDRLQGLNDLMASLEDIKPSAINKPLQNNPTKPSRPPNTTEDINPYLSQLDAIQLSIDDNIQSMGSEDLGELDNIVGTLQKDAIRKGLDTDSQGNCSACKMPILGNALTAMGKQWHVDHFVCVSCENSLAHVTFFEHNGQPYCEKDHQELFSPKCAYCNGSILDQVVTALNKTWHPEHFFCAQCGKSFGHDGFHEHKGKAYCTEDYYEMFAPRCRACGNAIMDGFMSAMGTQWHPECFVCKVCHVPFKGGNIFELEGRPYCELHYHAARGTLCASCLKPVIGACVTALGKKYHPDHFKCAFCMTELNKGTFKEHQNKPYCHPCFIKLFG
ncbi:Paxillin-like [Oopsacas minuta]|uniref:Paxillin-like n=1 Tax=Oopsacas minuta TaxID=111878 RepID=A0AAV7JXA5_9METZ|nr:Paxillin-like [Oopsacas minuta]